MTNITNTNKNDINHLIVTETLFTSTEGMDSREIARLTGKRHDNIVKGVRRMLTDLQKEVSKFERRYIDPNGVERACFVLPLDECLTLVSGYSTLLRYVIVKRWRELEGFTTSFWRSGTVEDERAILENFAAKMASFGKLNAAAGLDPSWTTRQILEDGTKLEQETGINVLSSGIVAQQIGNIVPDLDRTLPAHAARIATGHKFVSASQIAKDFRPLSSSSVNNTLVSLGYATHHHNAIYTPTEAGRSFAATRVLASGRHAGTENVIGWNLDDIRFWGPVRDALIQKRDDVIASYQEWKQRVRG